MGLANRKVRMKIAIIENSLPELPNMATALRKAGHDVCAIHASKYTETTDLLFTANTLEQILEHTRAFAPDIVLLDHDLGLGFPMGSVVASKLGVPREQLIGIGSMDAQKYCGRRFTEKRHFESNIGYAEQQLLEFIANIKQ